MALLSEINIPVGTFVTYNLHLESRGSNGLRVSQLQELLEDVQRYKPGIPVLSAGDFNLDVSQGDVAAALGKLGFLNPFSNLHEPTAIPRFQSERGRAIDWILTRGPVVATNPQVHGSIDASDHYPLSLALELFRSEDSI